MVFGALLVYAAATKGLQPDKSVAALASGLGLQATSALAQFVVAALIVFEIALAYWLIAGRRMSTPCLIAIGFLLAGIAWSAFLMVTERGSDCGCGLPAFGKSINAKLAFGIVRNALLALALAWVVIDTFHSSRHAEKALHLETAS